MTDAPVWVTLATAIVGGLIAVGGSAVAPAITHRFTRKTESERRLREKAEEVVELVLAHDHWLDIYRRESQFGRLSPVEPAPLPKALALLAIYFPELRSIGGKLSIASGDIQLWALKKGEEQRQTGLVGSTDGYAQLYEAYVGAQRSVIDGVAKEVARLCNW